MPFRRGVVLLVVLPLVILAIYRIIEGGAR